MSKQRRPVDLAGMSVPELIQQSMTDFTREDLYIGIPVTIKNVDRYESHQVVDVQAVINDEYRDEMIVNAPVLKGIFVKLPSGGGFTFKLPISVGDLATLHYSHRNISDFLSGGGESVTTPIDIVADIKDCYVIHGFGTRSNNQSPSKDNLIIEGKNSKQVITPEGKQTSTFPNTVQTIYPDGKIETVTKSDITTITEGKSYLKASEHTIDNNVKITGTLEVAQAITSDVSCTAPIVAAGSSLTVADKEMSQHVHAHGTPNTSPPI